MVSLNSATPLQGLRIGTVMPASETGAGQGSQSVKDVIDKLAQALTKGGHLDQDSPLGKMVAKELPFGGKLGGDSPDGIKAALSKLIQEKLGDNFGAAADAGLGTGAGQPDLMSQVLNALGKSSLDDLLNKQGDGTKFSKDDMPMLNKIAQFMDDNPSKFPAPDSGSWANELKEDNFLDQKETGSFRAALDMLGAQLGQQQAGVGASGSGLGSPTDESLATDSLGGQSDPLQGAATQGAATQGAASQDLGQLLSGLLEKGLQSTQAGNSAGGGLGTPVNDSVQPQSASAGSVNQDLSKLLGGLLQKGLEATLQGNSGASGQGNQMFAQHDLQSSAAQTAQALIAALTQSTSNTALS